MPSRELRAVLALNVRRCAEERGLTLTALAGFADVSRAHLQDMLARKKSVRLDWLEKLARGLEIEPWKLLVPEKR